MAKRLDTVFVCQNCGSEARKWLGQCPDCREWDTFAEERDRSGGRNGRFGIAAKRTGTPAAVAYSLVESQEESRLPSGIEELDRVLGGGIVAGSIVLIGGAPGIGKSTLAVQMADKLSGRGRKILYVTGEESERQLKMRGERLGLSGSSLFLLPETDLQSVFASVEHLGPDVLIVDSIQTMFSERVESAPGSVSQVREVAAQLMMLAKQTGVPVFVTGHVTKDGSIAGPKTLEHIVDTVLYFEGDRHHNHRIIRATKNRFGAVNEIGVFEMTNSGLVPVANPSELFLQERPAGASGSAVTVCIEGTRPMLLEVQALVGANRAGSGRRMAQGFDYNRASLLIAVMEKRLGFQFVGDDVFINVAGGIEIDEPAADLGIVAAVASSFRNREIDRNTALFGEVGLTGEVRGVLQASARVQEARSLGFEKLILPRSNLKGSEKLLGIRTIGVDNLEQAMEELFG
ncbi:MAG TPA: DNA repair protein RadA [Pyrinomonadaceae bacterium]|nr:DNA repair protein RadA [Pyrinomonadaceae bacterium]